MQSLPGGPYRESQEETIIIRRFWVREVRKVGEGFQEHLDRATQVAMKECQRLISEGVPWQSIKMSVSENVSFEHASTTLVTLFWPETIPKKG